jgi:hypothetical protein
MEEGGWPLRAGGAVEMEKGGRPRSGAVEMPASEHSDVMENIEASAAECRHGAAERKCLSVGSLLENESTRVLEMIRLLGRWAGVTTLNGASGRSDALSIAFLFFVSTYYIRP